MTLLPFQDYLPKALKPLKCCHAHIVAKGKNLMQVFLFL